MKYLYLWEVDKISRDGGFVLVVASKSSLWPYKILKGTNSRGGRFSKFQKSQSLSTGAKFSITGCRVFVQFRKQEGWSVLYKVYCWSYIEVYCFTYLVRWILTVWDNLCSLDFKGN